jgi:hypothetical protein
MRNITFMNWDELQYGTCAQIAAAGGKRIGISQQERCEGSYPVCYVKIKGTAHNPAGHATFFVECELTHVYVLLQVHLSNALSRTGAATTALTRADEHDTRNSKVLPNAVGVSL